MWCILIRSENCTQRDQQNTKGHAKLLIARTQLAGRWATAAQYVTLLMQPATWAKKWRRGDCSILFLDLKHVYIDYHDCCMHVLPNWKGVRKGSTAELLVCPVFCETANYRNISLCAYTASQHSTNQQNGCGMPQHHSSKQWQNLSSTALIAARTLQSSCTMLWGKGCYHLKATNGHHKVARPSSGGRFVNDWRNISLDTHSKKWNGWWSGNFPVKPKLQNDPVLTFPSIINQPSIKPTAWVRSKSRNPGPRQFETNHHKPTNIIFLVVHLMNSEFPWNI